jgi:4-hydroxybenzoate polyprenyltransferase
MMPQTSATPSELTGAGFPTPDVPLCVDLDGALSPVDTLHESVLALARNAPWTLIRLPLWWRRGSGAVRREMASRGGVDTSTLPLNAPLLEWLSAERSAGRRLILVTASHPDIAHEVADRLHLFDEILVGDKRTALVARFGERGFDYAGHARTEAALWSSARRAIVVGGNRQIERIQGVAEVEREFHIERPTLASWMKAVRLHQWAKNVLIFLPALCAHRIFHAPVLFASMVAFFSFSLCASSIYLVNDLLDLASDRRHARKRHRQFAAGIVSARSGILVSLALLAISLGLAFLAGERFAAVLCAYYVLTWAYSLRLKRAALVDVMTLASLYTIRIIAGAAATQITVSFWLLAFSIFVFLSLAIVKRYTEISEAAALGNASVHGRGYSSQDLPLLLNLGVAAGYCTVVVMALYINSMDALLLYHRTKPLWLVCPLLLYWISRIWMLTTRGEMPDDPVVFTLRDRISLCVLGLVGLIVLISI